MKKLLSLFVPLMALFLTLSPQTAKATPNYLRISAQSASYALSYDIGLVGDWTDADVTNLNFYYRTKSYGGSYGSWTQVKKRYSSSKNNSKYGVASAYGSLKNASGFTKEVEIKCTPNSTLLAQLGKTKHIQIDVVASVSATDLCSVSGNVMTLFYGDDADNYSDIPIDYAFYELFDTKRATGTATSSSSWTADFSGLELPATGLTTGCYEGMFSNMTTHMVKGPVIKALTLSDECGNDYTDCCKNMFNGCSNLASLTAYFLAWGQGTGSSSPTYNWITSTKALTFNCPSALTQTQDASHMGSNGTKNASVTPNAYVFDVATNSGTWDGSCSGNKYFTTAAPSVPTPNGSSFDGWYTESSGGNSVTPGSLGAPSGVTTYYAHYLSSTSYTLTITTPTHGTLVVKDNGNNSISSGASVTEGTTLTLTATPAAGYRFKGYTGDATSGTFTMPGENATIGVEFEEDLCEVTIASPSNGTLTASDGTNNYSAGTTYSFNRQTDAGKEITFTATPASHYTFSSWTDASSLLTNKTSAPYTDGQVCTAKLTIGNSSPLTYTVGASFALSQYTITTSATNGTVSGGGTYEYGTVINLVPLGASHYSFLKWSDENTDNPRSVTVTGNASYTAIFEFNPSSVSSADAAATIYQAGTGAGGKKILYDLSPTTDVNNPSITYTPIDLGYGVAWADRNIGATSETDGGGLFYWGGLTAISSPWPNTTYYSGINSITDRTLPLVADAAYQTMGGNTWRVPTKAEWEALLNTSNTNLSSNFTGGNNTARMGNGTITSKTVPANSITLPKVGIVRNQSYTQMGDYCNYWSASLIGDPSGASSCPYILYTYNYGHTLESMNMTPPVSCCWLLPIRAIYSPDYPICTLTIISGAYTYIYLCEIGQKVTITATPNDGYVFNKWSEDNNTNAIRTFTVMEDATYTATFTSAPTYTLAWSSSGSAPAGGTAAGSYITGTTITAPTTSKTGYTVSKWRDETNGVDFNGTMPANNVTYTAQWTANTYYVSFDPDEGSGTMTDQTFTYGVAQNLKPNAFTGPAVTVTYNYNDADGGNSPASETVNASFYMWTDGSGVNFYEDKESVSNLTATNGATVALTAIWDFDQEVTLPSPTKTGYTFVQWETGEEPLILIAGEAGEGYAPYEDVTLNAHWNAINYTITYNGLNDASNSNPATYTIESSAIVLADPGTRAGYTFTGWTDDDNSNAAVTQIAAGSTGNRHFTANWSADTYNLTYEGLNGASNSNPATYTIETATFALANPGTRTGYTFTGWTCGGNPITQITIGSTGDKTITANWSTNTHNVSWVTDGNALTGTYTNGTTEYGTTIVAPNTPTKNATAQYTYTFNGWSPAVAATMPDNDVEYTATWTETPVSYTLTWDFDGGSTVTAVGDYTNGTVAYGTTIVAPADPTKEGCTFNGWDVTPAGTMPAANTTYTAQWTACATELHIVLDEHAEDGDDYYDDFQKYNGVTATTVTLNRQFGQGKWATLCLPFEVSYGQMTNLRMKGRVYEFRHATGNANDGNQVTLFFAQAEKLTAGKAYIVNANAKLAELTQFVFHNVTINTSADQIQPLNSISQYNDLADMVGYSDGTGTIQLVGTLRLGTLKGSNSGNTYMGLKDNKIYYPSTSEPGSTVWAYRGVFRSTTPLGAQRIRIVVEGDEGEEVTELEVINSELQQAGEAKKFVQDGVLYIEREGVIYDAQGKLIVEN